MGLRTWAAAAAMAVSAWAGTANAAVYTFKSDQQITYMPYGGGGLAPFYLDTPLFDLRLGDTLIVEFTVNNMPKGSHEPPFYERALGFLIYGPEFHVEADNWLNSIMISKNMAFGVGGDSNDVRFSVLYRGNHDFGTVVTIGGENAFRIVARAVPEPSTWAMMIVGFFGLGFAAYRRRYCLNPTT